MFLYGPALTAAVVTTRFLFKGGFPWASILVGLLAVMLVGVGLIRITRIRLTMFELLWYLGVGVNVFVGVAVFDWLQRTRLSYPVLAIPVASVCGAVPYLAFVLVLTCFLKSLLGGSFFGRDS